MTVEELEHILGDGEGREFLEFERIENKRSNRPDLHAFLLLDSLVPGTKDMISAAEHDEFYLSIELGELASVISSAQAIELVRCGVRYSDDSLCMFV